MQRNARKKQVPMSALIWTASTLPDELDTARLFVIEVFDMETPQCSQMVSPHDAFEEPVPIKDQAWGPTITLMAPPYTCNV
jgi:hypothetical protein